MTTSIVSFAATAATWQSFYILAGTAAATLIGLMFVAVTFGATLVKSDTATTSARAFLDPPFYHFAHVLFTACLVVVPTMRATLLGWLVLAATLVRFGSLLRTLRHMREAERRFHDLELSDWMSGFVVPLACYLLLGGCGVAFVENLAPAFEALAVATLVTLLLGVYGAWELIIWLALTRAQRGA